ncbi:MoaD/ThiS family protein [Planctomonas psychrotolerans]|uniref:MoaD/ThiS family protein n=1 Tax=Planctomonas psychrotolerans TaxID=2528712 RepID=UPI001D0D354C|nr:MoaD/ThiS family protein [Planctomonas psychrotolerans]
MMRVDVHYFAAARAARGRSAETIEAEDGASIATLLDAVLRDAVPRESEGNGATTPDRGSLEEVFARCSFLVNAEAASGTDHSLAHGDRLDVLPPFAGG